MNLDDILKLGLTLSVVLNIAFTIKFRGTIFHIQTNKSSDDHSTHIEKLEINITEAAFSALNKGQIIPEEIVEKLLEK